MTQYNALSRLLNVRLTNVTMGARRVFLIEFRFPADNEGG